MRRMLSLAFAAVSSFAQHAEADSALSALKWKARPIVIVSDSAADPRVARQVLAFAQVRSALQERDVQVLREAGLGGVLRKRLGVAARGFAVVLVGKDGDVKQVWHNIVDPRAILALIDQMPMRREEMRG